MKLESESVGVGRHLAVCAAAITLALLGVLGIPARAQAGETIYWDNYGAEVAGHEPATIGFADIDGTGGGALNLAGAVIEGPEGMAYDSANGRIYVASSSNDEIVWVAIDGSGAGVLDTAGAPIENPQGIALDPRTQMVYWANTVEDGSIGYASAIGGGGGTLNTVGATTRLPYKVALDTVDNRLYWAGSGGEFSYANLDGSGGANLNVPEAERPGLWGSIDFDITTGRLYFFEEYGPEKRLRWINSSGVGGGEVDIAGANVAEPYGMAFDPSDGRFFWGNFANGVLRNEAIGTVGPTGGGGGITPVTAPVDAPQDPLVLKSPVGAGVPQISASGTTLSCSHGSWQGDYPGSYVYLAPSTFAYQWAVDGQAIAGATGSTVAPTAAGTYTCAVTASNAAGSAEQTSAGATVIVVERTIVAPPGSSATTPATVGFGLGSKRPVEVEAGEIATIRTDLRNGGGTASGAVKVCGSLTRKAKEGLLAPRCVSVASVPAGGTVVAKLPVKTRKAAKGLYEFPVVVSGATTGVTTAKVKVVPAKGKKKHHR